MSQIRTISLRTLVMLFSVTAAAILLSACTHWGGHGGGHHSKRGMYAGNDYRQALPVVVEATPPAQSLEWESPDDLAR